MAFLSLLRNQLFHVDPSILFGRHPSPLIKFTSLVLALVVNLWNYSHQRGAGVRLNQDIDDCIQHISHSICTVPEFVRVDQLTLLGDVWMVNFRGKRLGRRLVRMIFGNIDVHLEDAAVERRAFGANHDGLPPQIVGVLDR